MIPSIQKMPRSLSPFEHLILKCMCTGQSNLAISENTHFPVKTIENAISRAAKVLGVNSTPHTNLRVLLALVYGAQFQTADLDSSEKVRLHLASLLT